MARRRDGLAPYEIMGSSRPGGAEAPVPERPEPEAAPLMAASAGGGPWWDAGVPVVLRLPRGFAVLAGVAILVLIFLAYWVGYSRGASAERAAYDAEQNQLRIIGRTPSGPGRVVEVGPPVDDAGAEGENGGQTAAFAHPGATDPREPGLNYLILARYPHEDASRLARFLAERGVETAIVPGDNASLAQVVALRGFSSEQYGAGEHREYEDQLQRLGRAWQTANGGRGDNLSSMYWQRYKSR